ncbi:glycosyltransferase [Rheinheimera sp. MMS21-TC3]|uniref:glycosyltransferase n=1 Tax=Rheinheimera sp. MMS21-TC3 TaxID=3072790 RepID=UPI0028C386E1|nr:glycosyltransferase [Rheinheimera sp. MMS21-TC3]WNO61672.1 glycosyltransferase [Rheinheimera sp. MMS21-TC3]
MTNSLISVYIPTHNRPVMLARAIQSVINQDYSNIEIIVVDDGSTAQNQSKAEKLCAQHPNIIYIKTAISGGACAARNLAINKASGDFITGLDDDDEFLPNRLSAFMDNWHKFTDLSLLCTGYKFILPGGKVINSGQKAMAIGKQRILDINDVGNQVFTKTEYLKAIAGFDPNLEACQDYDVWIRLIQTFGTGYRLPLINYIVHQEHDSPRISQLDKRQRGHKQLITKHQEKMTPQQIRSQQFFCALYGGEQNIWRLTKLSGCRHLLVLFKVLFVRALSTKR